jgi:DNA-repair protein complementing XP-A cells
VYRYDLATLKNSKGGFLVENEESDPRKVRERQLAEDLAKKRMQNARKQGMLHDPGPFRHSKAKAAGN